MSKFTPLIEPSNPKPFTNIKLYHICSHCAKEYQAYLHIYNSNTEAVAMSRRCIHCNNQNNINIRMVHKP